jgi:hypothetical protein
MIEIFKKQINPKKLAAALPLTLCLFVFGLSSKENSLRAQNETAITATGATKNKPLIMVYLQGYNSCRKIEERPVRIFMQAAASNPNSKLYWGCFDGGHLSHLHDTKEYFYLFSMNHLGQWSKAEEVEPQSGSLQIAHYIQKDLRLFAKQNSEKELPKADIFIVGHSHGGWMAMKVAYQMRFIEVAKLQQLLTIDPISYTLCASHWFPFHVLYNTFNWLGEPDNCHKAPADLDHIIPTIAQTASQRWVNIYQDSMPYLTSGPIEQADQNIRYEPPTNLDWVTAHRAIMRTDWTWTFFANRLADTRGLPTKPTQNRPDFTNIHLDD